MPLKFSFILALVCLLLNTIKAGHLKTRDTTDLTTSTTEITHCITQTPGPIIKTPPPLISIKPFPLITIPFPEFCPPTLGRYGRGFVLLVAANVGGIESVQINALVAQHLLNPRLARKLEDQIAEALGRDNCDELTVTEGLRYLVNKTEVTNTDLKMLFMSANCMKPSVTIKVDVFLSYIRQNTTKLSSENIDLITDCPQEPSTTGPCTTPPCNHVTEGAGRQTTTQTPNVNTQEGNNNRNRNKDKSLHGNKDRSHHGQKNQLRQNNRHSPSHQEHQNRALPHDLHKARSHVHNEQKNRHQSHERPASVNREHKTRSHEKEQHDLKN